MSRFYQKNGDEVPGLREARKLNAVPSVTTIINAVTPHSYKFMDSQRLYDALESDGDFDEKLELLGNSAVFEQGHIVHEAAQMFLDIGVESVLLDCEKSSKEFYQYLSKIKPFHVEEFYYSKKIGTGGRMDLIGIRDGKNILVDYKTVSKVKKTMEKSWMLQLGAYYALAKENDIPIHEAEIVQFSKKDKGVIILKADEVDLEEYIKAFVLARDLYRFYIGI